MVPHFDCQHSWIEKCPQALVPLLRILVKSTFGYVWEGISRKKWEDSLWIGVTLPHRKGYLTEWKGGMLAFPLFCSLIYWDVSKQPLFATPSLPWWTVVSKLWVKIYLPSLNLLLVRYLITKMRKPTSNSSRKLITASGDNISLNACHTTLRKELQLWWQCNYFLPSRSYISLLLKRKLWEYLRSS